MMHIVIVVITLRDWLIHTILRNILLLLIIITIIIVVVIATQFLSDMQISERI